MNKLLFSQRKNLKRVVDVAEDLLGYRLNRLNNSLLWTSLNRPGMTMATPLMSPHPSEEHPEESHYSNTSSAIHADEAKVILSWIDKLKGTSHPLVKYTRHFDAGGKSLEKSDSYQIRSMVVLLVANMFGVSSKLRLGSLTNDNHVESALSKQKIVAEIAETIYTAQMLHRTVIEIPKEHLPTLGKVDANSSSDNGDETAFKGFGISMHQGNKVATLMGDLLLARCSRALSDLKHAKVTELMSDSIADFSESESIVAPARIPISIENFSTINKDSGLTKILNYDTWMRRNSLGICSLLRNACISSLIFSGHENNLSSLAGSLGYKIGLALQAHKDYLMFENDFNASSQIDLCSLPIIFQLENNSNLISSSSDIKQVHDEVINSSYAKAKTREKLLVLTEDAISHISNSQCSNTSATVLQDFLITVSS